MNHWHLKKTLLELNLVLLFKQFNKLIMGNITEINIQDWAYYFFNDMITIEVFDSTLLKIDKKSYKNIDIYYIGYIIKKNQWLWKSSVSDNWWSRWAYWREKWEQIFNFWFYRWKQSSIRKIHRTLGWD